MKFLISECPTLDIPFRINRINLHDSAVRREYISNHTIRSGFPHFIYAWFLDIVFLLSCQYVFGMFITSDIEWLITTLLKEVVASLISFLQTRWSFFNFLWLLNENVGDTKRVRVHYITIIIQFINYNILDKCPCHLIVHCLTRWVLACWFEVFTKVQFYCFPSLSRVWKWANDVLCVFMPEEISMYLSLGDMTVLLAYFAIA